MSDDETSAALARVRIEAPVSELARPQVDEWAVRRMWEGIQRRKDAPAKNERRHIVLLAGFAVLASVLALAVAGLQLVATHDEPAALREAALRDAALKAAASTPLEAPASGAPGVKPPEGPPIAAPPPEPLLTRDARRFELLEAPALPVPAAGGARARPPTAATAQSTRVDFTDGSSIEAAPGTRVEALASSPGEFAVMVRRGVAQFHVTPGGPRRWRIEASRARVEVLGTVLSVESDDAGTSVRVD
ncbi:MAG TPA: FecR family protein, partial [Polyangiaceae bacterium]|nr:FecR family protein [Polyangiaceae bacterium]